jgi:hypothetical protein
MWKWCPLIENWEIIFRNILFLCQNWILMSAWWPIMVTTAVNSSLWATTAHCYSCSRVSDSMKFDGADNLVVIRIPGNKRQCCAGENCKSAGWTASAKRDAAVCIPCFSTFHTKRSKFFCIHVFSCKIMWISETYVFSSVNMCTAEFVFISAISLSALIDVTKWVTHMILYLYVM